MIPPERGGRREQRAERGFDARGLGGRKRANGIGDVETRFERSRALALLAGLGGDTQSGVTATEAAGFADQAVVALRDAFSAGWGWGDKLKEPDFDALRAAPTRIVVAVGAESEGELAHRAGEAVAERLGTTAVTFPSHHAGFVGGDSSHAGQPEAFAAKLREFLAAQA